MIQSAILFLLGFLCATFIALLALPAIWRRAVRLTRRGIEASLPLTAEEISAAKDQQRAEYAMAVRRLELQLAETKTKSATQTVEAIRERRKMERLSNERSQLRERNTDLEARHNAHQAELQARDEVVKQFAAKAEEVENALAERITELGRLGRLYEEATLTSTARHVEVIAHETEIDRLDQELAKLRGERTKAVKTLERNGAAEKVPVEGIVFERKRIRELQEKIDLLYGDLADRDDKIARREREIERLKSSRGQTTEPDDLRLIELQKDNLRLVSELAELQEKMGASPADRQGDEQLRDAIHRLAADVVSMTAKMEQHAAPIARALDEAERPAGDRPDPHGAILSLAERIRKLHKERAKSS